MSVKIPPQLKHLSLLACKDQLCKVPLLNITTELQQVLSHPQSVSEAPSDVLVSKDIGQTRLKLLASLLRAIEETNGGTLSHLEEPEEEDDSQQQLPSNSGETGK